MPKAHRPLARPVISALGSGSALAMSTVRSLQLLGPAETEELRVSQTRAISYEVGLGPGQRALLMSFTGFPRPFQTPKWDFRPLIPFTDFSPLKRVLGIWCPTVPKESSSRSCSTDQQKGAAHARLSVLCIFSRFPKSEHGYHWPVGQ